MTGHRCEHLDRRVTRPVVVERVIDRGPTDAEHLRKLVAGLDVVVVEKVLDSLRNPSNLVRRRHGRRSYRAAVGSASTCRVRLQGCAKGAKPTEMQKVGESKTLSHLRGG